MTPTPDRTPYQVAADELLLAQAADEPMSHVLRELGPHEQLGGIARRLVDHHREVAERSGEEPEVVAFVRGALFGAVAQRAADRTSPPEDLFHPPSDRE